MYSSVMVHQQQRQRQLRGFVIAWLGITLLIGALTFVGIYYATGLVNQDNGDNNNVNVVPLTKAEQENAEPDNSFDLNQIDTTPVSTINPLNAAPSDTSSETEVARAMQVEVLAQVEPEVNPVENAPPEVAAQDATPVPSPTPRPMDNPAFQLGVQVQPNADASVYQIWINEVHDKLKLGWIKHQVRWKVTEPQPGQYNWAELDVALSLAQESGLNVMVSVVDAPDWAREPGNQRLNEVGPPNDPQVFANFLITMLYRYPGQIHAVEVWNEMNIDREWASIYGLSAANYVTLLHSAYNTIKSVDPSIIVISGALSPAATWDDGSAIDDLVYMEQMIQAGLLDTVDCVGAHHNGYNIGPNVPWNNVPNDPTAQFRGPFDNAHHSWSFYSTLQGYAQRIQQTGSDKKLCVTEFGWASTEDLAGTPIGFEFANDNTLAEQAQFFDEAIQLMDSWGFVWLAWIWNLNYGAPEWDPTNDNVPYALLRPEWQTAPAYEVIAQYNFIDR